MAKKGILRDTNNVEILPVTRGELVLDSSGKEALRSKEFLATDSWPGLMSSEDKEKLNTLTKIDIDSELKLDSENPVQNKIIANALENKADISDNLVLAEGMKNTEGITFNLPNSSDEETQVLATQDDILRIVTNSDEVYVGDDIPEDDDSIKVWIDTDAGFDYSGNIIEAADGASVYTVYAEDNLSGEQQAYNKKAFESVISKEEAVYYVSISEKAYITSYTLYNNNTAIFACSNVTVTSDGGNLMSAIVSVNEDGSIANLTFQEGTVPSLEYINNILEEKGASIPVVTSEDELNTLTQNKGDLALIMSDDNIKMDAIPVLDLYQMSQEEVEACILNGTGFINGTSIQGIQLDPITTVPPCLPAAGKSILVTIAPRYYTFGKDLLQIGLTSFSDTGVFNGVIMAASVLGTLPETAIATTDDAGKIIWLDTVDIVNNFISSLEDPVYVFTMIDEPVSMLDSEAFESVKESLSFFKGLVNSSTFGYKSLRIKGDEKYVRLDSDVIRCVDKDAVGAITTLNMPEGSLVRTCIPSEAVYDTDLLTFVCCATDPTFNSKGASIVSKIEFVRTCTTEPITEDDTPKCPYIILTNETGSSKIHISWIVGAKEVPLAVAYSTDAWQTSVPLLANGEWSEENLESLQSLIDSGIHFLAELGKESSNLGTASGGGSMYDPKTGLNIVMTEYGDVDDATLDQVRSIVNLSINSFVSIYCNERVIPEHVDSYSRLSDGWIKENSTVETESSWSLASAISTKPVQAQLVYRSLFDFEDRLSTINSSLSKKQDTLVSGTNIATINGQSLLNGGNITIEGNSGIADVDDALSTTSENPVQNKVITGALNNKVSVVSGKGLSTNDYTTSDKNKLAGIAAGAEVNVQSDWNATSGDAYILNKPVFATINGNPIDKGGNITIAGLDDPTANDSLQDIIKFLEGTIEEQTLAGIIENLQNQINTKQFTLVNGESIKTVNGQNLLGGGNIDTIGVIDDQLKDTSTNPVQNKVIKEYVDTRVDEIKNIGTLATITSVDTTNEVDDVLESLLDEISGETIQYINQINGEII